MRRSRNVLSSDTGAFPSIIMQSHLRMICPLRSHTPFPTPCCAKGKISQSSKVCWFLYVHVVVKQLCVSSWIRACFCCFIMSWFCVSLSLWPAGEQRDGDAKRSPFRNCWNSVPERGAGRPRGSEAVQLPPTVRGRLNSLVYCPFSSTGFPLPPHLRLITSILTFLNLFIWLCQSPSSYVLHICAFFPSLHDYKVRFKPKTLPTEYI